MRQKQHSRPNRAGIRRGGSSGRRMSGVTPTDRLDDPTLLLNERQQQVDGLDDLVLIFLRQVPGSEQGLLGFYVDLSRFMEASGKAGAGNFLQPR